MKVLEKLRWKPLLMVVVFVIYWRVSRDMINSPMMLNVALGTIVTSFYSIYFFRAKRVSSVAESGSKKDWADHLISISTIIIVSFCLFIIVKVPINYGLVWYGKTQSVVIQDFDIEKFRETRSKRVKSLMYRFVNGEKYWLNYENEYGLSEADLQKNYKITLGYSKSLFGAYIKHKFSIGRKLNMVDEIDE